MILPNKHHHDDRTEQKTNWKLKQRSSKVSLIMIDNQLYIHPFHSVHPKMLLLVFHVSVPHATSFVSLSITGCLSLTVRVCVRAVHLRSFNRNNNHFFGFVSLSMSIHTERFTIGHSFAYDVRGCQVVYSVLQSTR